MPDLFKEEGSPIRKRSTVYTFSSDIFHPEAYMSQKILDRGWE